MGKIAAPIMALAIAVVGVGIWYYVTLPTPAEDSLKVVVETADRQIEKRPGSLKIQESRPSTVMPNSVKKEEMVDNSVTLPETFEERVRAERARINSTLDYITPLSSEDVLASIIDALRGTDNILLNVAANELVSRVRRGDDLPVDLIDYAWDEFSSEEQAYLVKLLGRMASEAAVQTLIDRALGPANEDRRVRNAALYTISNIGVGLNEVHLREILTPVLETSFISADPSDDALTVATALGLSTIGTAHGVATLLDYLEDHDPGPAGEFEEGDISYKVAAALKNVRNPEGIEPLQARLFQDPNLDGNISRVAGNALAAMRSPEAVAVLLDWAVGVEEEATRNQALAWFQQITTKRSLDQLLENVNSSEFLDPQLQSELNDLALQIQDRAQPGLIDSHDHSESISHDHSEGE